ncbi:hypothetical protein [Rhodococcus rhodochrous]|nr:hypothetical protein [Rhodococcus rhodochrous]
MTNKVKAAMTAGVRGELLSSHPLVQVARKNDAPIVIGIYVGSSCFARS